jgi:DNA-binding CsgD family transcriptional regulator
MGRSDGHQSAVAIGDLSPRELDVIERTAQGHRNADVAADLGITIHAVKFHLASIFRKLNAHNRTEATVTYLKLAAGPRGEEPTT